MFGRLKKNDLLYGGKTMFCVKKHHHMRNIIFVMALVSVLFLAKTSNGQQEPQFDFYPYVHMFTNPGYSGMGQAICATLDHRQQWMGFEGNPVTTGFAVSGFLEGITSGIGLIVLQDKLGYEKNTHIKLSYSYHMDVGDGTLGIGAGLGIKNKSLNPDQWNTYGSLENPNQNPYEDPAIPHAGKKMAFASSLGAFYLTDYLYAGLGIDNLIQSKLNYETGKEYFLKRHYYLTAGYYYTLPNPVYEIRPSIFISSDGVVNQYTLGASLLYNKAISGGIGYRFGDSFIIHAGYVFPFNMTIALAYDVSLSKLSKYNNGSFEVVLNYCFNLSMSSGRGGYKSVRLL